MSALYSKVLNKLTDYFVRRGIVAPENAKWCQYLLEKDIGSLLFLSSCIIIGLAGKCLFHVISFLLSFCLLRERQGGWHAKTALFCLLLSIGVTVSCVIGIGPLLEGICYKGILLMDVFALVFTFCLTPSFPPAMHISEENTQDYILRRNYVALGLLLLQSISLIFKSNIFPVYSFLGICVSDLSVLLEVIKNKSYPFMIPSLRNNKKAS